MMSGQPIGNKVTSLNADIMHTLSTVLKKLAAAAVLTFIIVLLIMTCASCRVSKNISTSKVNTDSLVTHVKDSMSVVHSRETSELKRMLEEMTSSGVTFVVDSCPERDAVLALLDSAGRANYEKALLQDRVKSLSNKVTISEKGAITAEGRIKEAKFTNTRLQEELLTSERTIDQLTKENEDLRAKLTKSVKEKDKDIKKKPAFGGYAMTFGAGALSMLLFLWWYNKKRKVKSVIMNKATLFILSTLLLTSCGKHADGTSVWAEGVWIIPMLMLLGGLTFMYLAYRASKSNSTQQYSGGTKDNTGNVPIYKVGKFWLAVALFVAAVVVVIVQNSEK